ncbi:pyruvate dehydrogenase complex dihydrolipoamide acetyltransferase [Paremcibacter congregatus]|mgnify:CR=1 FL=1|uniref:Acetyltransferase component of pyruvate dehydrogenase complex n=1 Tax=Paremcibacter congregatus TaxID=2043170 RepID=A0A2G4YUX8_9PROT|nr:pyruvate dehydrogenase complex dihydrolipoamide acetyltransferase [Paremcibacter congregatus]PHZ86142.1 pyruvate dehydrogenase complex dihydrolipoamide acetyltransferase [Paremcibacter congregatus]QDE27107.1 pyruvate dehydrogenase complex dihydrolipoamide acetyltransferase [Paremcibacter congregatus]
MAIELNMPALSPTMESGTLAKWLVKEGDVVESGTVLAEIETDKATMEFESIDEGTVGKIFVPEGTENVAVGDLIAVLLEEGEDASVLEGMAPGKTAAAPEAKTAPKAEAAAPTKAAPAMKPLGEVGPFPKAKASGDRIFASPLARRIAEQNGFEIADIPGSGPHGRVIKRDVESFTPAVTAAKAAGLPSLEGDAPFEEIKLSNMRKTIAKRLTESKQTVPHFYLGVDIELDNLLAARKELNSMSDEYKISVNDFIIRACALALKKVPAANVQFGGDVMRQYSRSDISVAVAIEGGLVTPVIRGAEQKGLRQISDETKALAKKARDGKLMPEDYQGGTFSISNLGMMGIKQFQAVINPPQAAILAIGSGEQRPVIKDGQVTAATVMSVNLACDHRAIDGAVGAEFLAALKTYLEHPSTMLL